MLFTALTLGTGPKGGRIVPVFFTGATFGCTVAPLLGLSPSFGAGLGMVCVFCGVTNCPITSLLMALELFREGSSAMFTGQSMGLFAVLHLRSPTPSPAITACIRSKKSCIVSSGRNLSIKKAD